MMNPSWIGVLLLLSHFPRQSGHISLMETITLLVLVLCDYVSHENCRGQAVAGIWLIPEKEVFWLRNEWMIVAFKWRSDDNVRGILPIHVNESIAIRVSLSWALRLSAPINCGITVSCYLLIEHLTLWLTLWGSPNTYRAQGRKEDW